MENIDTIMEHLIEKVGGQYISDLHEPAYQEKAMALLTSLPCSEQARAYIAQYCQSDDSLPFWQDQLYRKQVKKRK